MSLWKKMFGMEKRASTPLSDPSILDILGSRAYSMETDISRASGLATANACIALIAQNLAAMPLDTYRRNANGGRERATDHPLYSILHDMANDALTAFQMRESLLSSVLVYGNGYALIERDGRGDVFALTPIDPTKVTVYRLANGRLRYKVAEYTGGTTNYLQEEILHIRHRLAPDGVMGLSPIQVAKSTFGLAVAQQDVAIKQAGRSFRMQGALVFPNAVPGEKKDLALSKLAAKFESDTAASGVVALDGGVDWKQISTTSKDAEFLGSVLQSNLDICRVFSVPPTTVGILNNASYSNADQESRVLVVRTLAPMAKRIEQAMNAALLTPKERETLFVEHNMDGLLRGDAEARYRAYEAGRNSGWLSVNEIRGMENLPAIDGGDEHLRPLNMTTVGADPQNLPGSMGK